MKEGLRSIDIGGRELFPPATISHFKASLPLPPTLSPSVQTHGTKCMNQLLFERSTGLLSPQRFARILTTQRIYAVQSCSTLRFNGGEKEVIIPENDAGQSSTGLEPVSPKLWAHQAGVTALAVDIENRVLLSGGLDSSIRLWDLEDCPADAKLTLKPTAAISRQVFQQPI